jgi:hypothetical protein
VVQGQPSMERLQKVEEIFYEARQRDAAERDSYLRQACRGYTELEHEVASLHVSHDRGTTFEPWPVAALRKQTWCYATPTESRFGLRNRVRRRKPISGPLPVSPQGLSDAAVSRLGK